MNKYLKMVLAIGVVFLFIISAVTPIVLGHNDVRTIYVDRMEKNYRDLDLLSCNKYNMLSYLEKRFYKQDFNDAFMSEDSSASKSIVEKDVNELTKGKPSVTSSGPMDSAWPMKCYDTRHTGRSPYSTADNPGTEKWRFKTDRWVDGGPVIDDDGIIYFGALDHCLYALYPDGSLKWKYRVGHWIYSTPAIADDGTIYIGSWDDYFYAINSDGTLKWKFDAGANICSSPVIAEDGTIYFGTMTGGCRIYAVNPDGTEKWHYTTGEVVLSDPVIGNDGTIYVGSCDDYFYAMNPNGTLKWWFKTGGYIKGPASIADDGTIYVASYDYYLYALYPNNGTMKWKCEVGQWAQTNPSIASDGTIYVGGKRIYAINPDGTMKWSFYLGTKRWVHASSPAISADGTVYVGTHISEGGGGEIIAINPDGTERWRKMIANLWVDSSPCISEDGTVYIGSSSDEAGYSYGYLHAFGSGGNNHPPNKSTITGQTSGNVEKEYSYTFSATDPDEDKIHYYIEWGDGTNSDWIGPCDSGEEIIETHTWSKKGSYMIRAKVKDYLDEESDWSTLMVSMPKNKELSNLLFFQVLEKIMQRFPILERILLHPFQ